MESSTGTEIAHQYSADVDNEMSFLEALTELDVPVHHYYDPLETADWGTARFTAPFTIPDFGRISRIGQVDLKEIPPWIPEQADIGQQPKVQVSDSYLHNCEVHLEQYPDQIIMTLTLNEPIDLVNITINTVPINPSKSSGPQPRFGWRG